MTKENKNKNENENENENETMLVEVRVLRDTHINGELFKPNSLLSIDKSIAAKLVSAGAADDDPAAVQYARDLMLVNA